MHLTFNISSLNPQRTVKAKWEQQHFLLPSIFTHVREGEQWIENEIPAKTYERHRERNFADKKGDKRNVEKMFSVVYGNKMQTWRARESVKPEKVTVSKIQNFPRRRIAQAYKFWCSFHLFSATTENCTQTDFPYHEMILAWERQLPFETITV